MKMIKQTKIETKKQKNLLLSILCFCLALFISGCGSSEPEENFVVENNMELIIPSKIGDRTVTVIGEKAFKDCTAFVSVDIPKSVTRIGDGAFRGCTSLESVDIPKSVTTIGSWAFWGCSSLKSVTIPKSVKEIVIGAFKNCPSLKEIKVPSDCVYEEGAFDEGCNVIRY